MSRKVYQPKWAKEETWSDESSVVKPRSLLTTPFSSIAFVSTVHGTSSNETTGISASCSTLSSTSIPPDFSFHFRSNSKQMFRIWSSEKPTSGSLHIRGFRYIAKVPYVPSSGGKRDKTLLQKRQIWWLNFSSEWNEFLHGELVESISQIPRKNMPSSPQIWWKLPSKVRKLIEVASGRCRRGCTPRRYFKFIPRTTIEMYTRLLFKSVGVGVV